MHLILLLETTFPEVTVFRCAPTWLMIVFSTNVMTYLDSLEYIASLAFLK